MRTPGGIEEWEAFKPKVSKRIWSLYNLFSSLRRDASDSRPIKKHNIEAVTVPDYETDMLVKVIQSADDHYLKLLAEKIKRMSKK